MASDDQTVLQAIAQLEARMESRLSGMEGRMSTIELVVADMDTRLKSWADMHYLTAAAKAQMVHTREIKSDVADIKVRMGDIYQAMATDPEIRSLREEVGAFPGPERRCRCPRRHDRGASGDRQQPDAALMV
jgi:hypothetical protein